jgi:hypothetical protein
MKQSLLSALCVVVFCVPIISSAETVIRTGEVVSIDASQILKGDFYGFAPDVSISGPAEDDVFVGWGTVTVNAPIKKDLTVVAFSSQIHGDVGDDVRVLGGEVTIAHNVKGDVVVAGGVLKILSTAHVSGDVLFNGGELTIDGAVDGNVHGVSKTTRIDGKVGGDVDLEAVEQITLGEKAELAGTLTYESTQELARAQGAVVVGDVRKIESVPDAGSFKETYLFIVFALAFSTLAVYMVGRSQVAVFMQFVDTRIGHTGLVGLGVFLALPFLGMVLLVSMVGSLIGVVLLSFYVALITLSVAVSSIVLGHAVQVAVFKHREVTLSTVCLGIAAFNLLILVPFVGPFILFTFIIIALGTLGRYIYHMLHA